MYVHSDEIYGFGDYLYPSSSDVVFDMICHDLSLEASGEILMPQRVENKYDEEWLFTPLSVEP